MNTYGPLYGASAIAANRFLSFLFAVAFPLFTIKSELSLESPYFALLFIPSPYSEFPHLHLVFSRIEAMLSNSVYKPAKYEDLSN